MSGIVAQNTLDNTGLIKSPAGGGAWNFIKELTASSSADLSFVDGASDVVLDSTYKEYIFYFVNIHPQTDGTTLNFNLSIDGGSNYNVVKTSTFAYSYHAEDGGSPAFGYATGHDLAQGTGFQPLTATIDNDADAQGGGFVRLFDPGNTTFYKHFIMSGVSLGAVLHVYGSVGSGFGETTSAVDAVQFKMSSGNIDTGSIFLHGLTA